MTGKPGKALAKFLLELGIYSVLVSAYFLVVLQALPGWLKWLFDEHRRAYAVAALAIIIAQAVALEILTSVLVKLARLDRD